MEITSQGAAVAKMTNFYDELPEYIQTILVTSVINNTSSTGWIFRRDHSNTLFAHGLLRKSEFVKMS